MKLSENLELAEMTRSESAKLRGVSNQPTPEHIENLKEWAQNIFQPIRHHFKRPIFISSGYRSAALNKTIKGASATSQHLKGEAGDIDMDGTEILNAQIFNFIKDNLNFDQLIWEHGTDKNPDWVHVSYSNINRKQILRCKKINGVVSYVKY